MKKKVFILGIGGLTGSKLCQEAKNHFEVFGSYNLRNPKFPFVQSYKMDFSSVEKIENVLMEIKPDVMINTLGINNVDYCEKHSIEAKKINVLVVKDLYRIAKKLGIKLIHLSSDSVFDGSKKTSYTEKDKPCPINFYGKTKLESENIVLENSENVVVRASVLYGCLLRNLAKLEICNYLKLDCEGAEYDIIESLPEEYFKKIEKIYIEYHFSDSKSPLLENMIKKLESVSFRIINEPMEQGMGSIFAMKKN